MNLWQLHDFQSHSLSSRCTYWFQNVCISRLANFFLPIRHVQQHMQGMWGNAKPHSAERRVWRMILPWSCRMRKLRKLMFSLELGMEVGATVPHRFSTASIFVPGAALWSSPCSFSIAGTALYTCNARGFAHSALRVLSRVSLESVLQHFKSV